MRHREAVASVPAGGARRREPGGTFVLDNEVPYDGPEQWGYWLAENRKRLPLPRKEHGERDVAADGREYELRTRLLDLDPLEQRATIEMHGFTWRDGELIAEDEYVLTLMLYFKDEIVLMLERAGFADVTVRAALTGAQPTATDDFLIFTAVRPA